MCNLFLWSCTCLTSAAYVIRDNRYIIGGIGRSYLNWNQIKMYLLYWNQIKAWLLNWIILKFRPDWTKLKYIYLIELDWKYSYCKWNLPIFVYLCRHHQIEVGTRLTFNWLKVMVFLYNLFYLTWVVDLTEPLENLDNLLVERTIGNVGHGP